MTFLRTIIHTHLRLNPFTPEFEQYILSERMIVLIEISNVPVAFVLKCDNSTKCNKHLDGEENVNSPRALQYRAAADDHRQFFCD